jgi:hypothetical protein
VKNRVQGELLFSMAESVFALDRLRILYHTRPRWKEREREVYIFQTQSREKQRFCKRVSLLFHANDEKLYRIIGKILSDRARGH